MSENAAPSARIVDRGYQHYQGVRLSPAYATRAMVLGAMRRALGIRRPARTKVLPWLLVLVAYAPSVVLLGIHIITGTALNVPYPRILDNVTIIFALFAGLIGPDLLCPDRRERVLSLYFAAPITRFSYVAAQAVGLIVLLFLLTLVPVLALFVGNALLAPAAGTYVHDHAGDLWHIILSGALLAAYFGALALAISSFTDRRAYASGAFLGLLLVSSAAGGILARGMRFSGHEQFALVNLLGLPIYVTQWLFGGPVEFNLNGWVCTGVSLGVVAVSLALLVWRYMGVRD